MLNGLGISKFGIDRKELSVTLLRVSMSLVFLYFGFMQVLSPDLWVSFVPEFLTKSVLTPNNFIVANGVMELTLGTFLLIGLYVRFASLILALHLLGIAFSIGFVPVGVRDFGLAVATFVVFLNGASKYSLDRFFNEKSTKE